MNPTVEKWNQDPEFRALPHEERTRILGHYFDSTMTDGEFYALPGEEQSRIRNYFTTAHIGEP